MTHEASNERREQLEMVNEAVPELINVPDDGFVPDHVKDDVNERLRRRMDQEDNWPEDTIGRVD